MVARNFCYDFVIYLILIYNLAFGLDPSITTFTSKFYHTSGMSYVYLECDVTDSTASVQFSKITPDGPVIIENIPGKYLQMNGLLMIAKLTRDDAGDYRCSLPDYNIYKDLTLNYEEQPSIIRFADWEYTLNKGDDFKLYCNTTGVPEPNVWWEKRDNNEFKIEGPLLHIPSVTADDIGYYYCKADNNVGEPVQTEIRIKRVNYAPEMTCVNTTVVSGRGWNVFAKLSCDVRAYPAESVEWWRKTETGRERVIEDDPKYNIFHPARYDDSPQGWYHEAALIIMVTRPEDAGEFIAVASNKLGTQEMEFTLKVV